MKGRQPTGARPCQRSFAVDRVCAAAGCSTRLSVYNASNLCWQHADIVFPTFRGKRTNR